MDIRLALQTGIDIPITELQLVLHQPTMKEIGYIGETDFLLGIQTLSINENMFSVKDNSLLSNTTNFQIFIAVMQNKETQDKKLAVKALFQIIFPQYQVIITPNSLLFQKDGQSIIVDDNNFNILQEIIKEVFCINSGPMDQSSFNPADEKAREIAAKLMRGRERVAAEKGEDKSSAFGRYISIITVGLNSMPISEAINLTMYQLYDLVERYSLYLNWDLDIRSRLAGGKPDNKPEDWMKNIH